jgi:hypothetical protein
MSGSDEVGVDPGRVSQAAAALQKLQEVQYSQDMNSQQATSADSP